MLQIQLCPAKVNCNHNMPNPLGTGIGNVLEKDRKREYKSSVHNALNLEAKANCWANTDLKEARRTEQNRREQNKKLKWTYQKVVKMSLLNTSMFILLLLLVPEYLFICALRTLLWVPLCNFSHSRRSRWQCEKQWTLNFDGRTDTWTGTSSSADGHWGRFRLKAMKMNLYVEQFYHLWNFLYESSFGCHCWLANVV